MADNESTACRFVPGWFVPFETKCCSCVADLWVKAKQSRDSTHWSSNYCRHNYFPCWVSDAVWLLSETLALCLTLLERNFELGGGTPQFEWRDSQLSANVLVRSLNDSAAPSAQIISLGSADVGNKCFNCLFVNPPASSQLWLLHLARRQAGAKGNIFI